MNEVIFESEDTNIDKLYEAALLADLSYVSFNSLSSSGKILTKSLIENQSK